MNLLVISISAPPKNSPESLQTGRYLLELSKLYNTTLITTRPSSGWAPGEEKLKRYLVLTNQIIELFNLPKVLIGSVKRITPSLTEYYEQTFFYWQLGLVRLNQVPDLLFSRSSPFSSAIMAYKLKQKFNVPWVMHLSDLWIDSPFYQASPKKLKIDSEWENKCFELADAITVTSQLTLQFYKTKYSKHSSKLHLLPNVVEVSSINEQATSFEGKVRFIFTGRLYGSRSPEKLLNAIKTAFDKRPDLIEISEFIFAGFIDPKYEDEFAKLMLPNVQFIGPISQYESVNLQRSAHILILIDSLEVDERYDLFFPSKLLEYLAARKRILAITRKTSTVSNVLRSDIADCFSNETIVQLPDFLIQCIEKFLAKDFSYFVIDSDIEEYTVEYQIRRLAKIFEPLIRKEI